MHAKRLASWTFVLLLGFFPLRYARVTASNDLWVQLLAADGFLSGRGFGYFLNGAYHPIAARPRDTRFAPGIGLLAAGIKGVGLDPLIVLVAAYPLLLAAAFLTLRRAVRASTLELDASVIAFAALTPIGLLSAYLGLSSEAIAWPPAIALLGLVLRKPRTAFPTARELIPIVALSWVLTLIRNAMVLVVFGTLLAYALIRVRGFRRRAALLAVSGLLSSLPMFLLVSGATTELREVRPTFDSPVRAFGHELSSNVQNFAEVLVPRTTRVSAAGWGIDLLAWLVLAGVVAITLRAYARSGAAPPDPSPGEGRPLSELAFVATTVAASYAVMLAGLSLFFGYEWSLVYRVQGFALPWMIVGACGAALGLASSARGRIVVLGVVLALAMSRYAYAVRYAGSRSPSRWEVEDYREAAAEFRALVERNFGNVKEVVIFADGDYGGRWLLRCLLYADSNDQKFPWTIRGLYDSSWSRGGLIAERDRAGSILAVVPVDLESEAASGLGKGGCGRKVETKDIVLFGACGEEAKKGSPTTLTAAGRPGS